MLIAGCALLGLLVGSFAGLLVDRVPEGRPLSRPRSHCESCGHPLAPLEMVPVLSWLALRGRCRHCGAAVPVQSTIVELATATLFGAMAWRFGAHWELGGFLVLCVGLVALAAIDLRTHTLPREIIYATAGLGAPYLVAGALAADESVRLQWAVFGAVGALAFFLLLFLGWPAAMGDGDVRLAALLGLFLGWIGPMHTPVGLFFGFLAGSIVGVVLLNRGAGRRTAVPFGPFMAAGAVVAILFGHPIIDLWIGGAG